MRTVTILAVLALCFADYGTATKVSQCQGKNYPDLQNNVIISKCNKPPCKLRKGTTVSVNIKFTPEHNIKALQTNVYADILGLPLPFVGVDGVTACDKIFTADGATPAPCPLEKGVEYLYKNSFPVLEIYPNVSPIVHWSLSEKGKDVICFEVPARIL